MLVSKWLTAKSGDKKLFDSFKTETQPLDKQPTA